MQRDSIVPISESLHFSTKVRPKEWEGVPESPRNKGASNTSPMHTLSMLQIPKDLLQAFISALVRLAENDVCFDDGIRFAFQRSN